MWRMKQQRSHVSLIGFRTTSSFELVSSRSRISILHYRWSRRFKSMSKSKSSNRIEESEELELEELNHAIDVMTDDLTLTEWLHKSQISHLISTYFFFLSNSTISAYIAMHISTTRSVVTNLKEINTDIVARTTRCLTQSWLLKTTSSSLSNCSTVKNHAKLWALSAS